MIEVKNIICFVHQGVLLLLFLSGLLLFCSSNKANYKGKKVETGRERSFKAIPFAEWNKRKYQGHG